MGTCSRATRVCGRPARWTRRVPALAAPPAAPTPTRGNRRGLRLRRLRPALRRRRGLLLPALPGRAGGGEGKILGGRGGGREAGGGGEGEVLGGRGGGREAGEGLVREGRG